MDDPAIRAQFVRHLQETNCTIASSADITRADVAEYLSHLGERGSISSQAPPLSVPKRNLRVEKLPR
jgi:hypothetical protein